MSVDLAPPTPATTDRTVDMSFFLPGLHGGGAERITLTLAEELARAGVAVELVLGARVGPMVAEIPTDLPVVDLGTPRLRSAVVPLARHLRRTRPAVLLPSVVHADTVAMLAGRLAVGSGTIVVPRVSTTLSQLVQPGRPLPRRLASRLALALYRRAPAVIACSHAMGADMVDRVGLPADRVRVLPNATVGADVPVRAAAPLDHPWIAGPDPVVLAVGSLTPVKNHRLLLDAFARVRAVRPVRLVVLGQGPLQPALLARAEALGVADDVSLPGFDPNPFRWMARADVMVLPSDWEGLPGVLIEALAVGANVVATDCPSGPREILEGGRHGRLVPVGDVDALATAIGAALDDPIRPEPAAWDRYTAAVAAAAYRDTVAEVLARA